MRGKIASAQGAIDDSFLEILETSPEGCLLIREGCIHFANRAAGRLLERTVEQLQQRPFEVIAAAMPEGLERELVPFAGGTAVWIRRRAVAGKPGRHTGLAASESQAVRNNLSDGLIIADSTGTILEMNPAILRLLGFSTLEEAVARTGEFEVWGRGGARLEQKDWPLEQALRGELTEDEEFEIRRKGLASWTARCRGCILRAADGNVRLVILVICDVTAQRGAERALNESETQRLIALEAAELGTWFWDLRGERIVWSDRARAILGFSDSEPVDTKVFYRRVHSDDRQALREALERARAQGGPIESDFRVLTPDGESRWTHLRGRPQMGPDGAPEQMGGVIVDVARRKRVEEELHRATATLRAIIDCSPMAIFTTDAAGQVAIWNRGAERILGYGHKDVLGKQSPIPIEARVEFCDQECKATRADGKPIDLLCSAAPMYGEENAFLGQVAVFADVTERKRLNREMEAAQKLESLGVLAGGVAHDFNNLLTGILGNASLSLYTLDENSEVRPMMEEVVRASERAAGLTRQLLAYAGKGRHIAKKLDLSQFAREMMALAKASIQNKKVELLLECEAGMPGVEGDTGQLQQVIMNLVINAAEAIEDCGTVRVVTRVTEIAAGERQSWETGEALAAGHYAVLEVSDTGVGMDEVTRSRIFEPFFSTKFTGRGLGLSAVLGIVRQHRGALSVESVQGRGSTFRVLLPASVPAVEEAPYEQSEDLRGGGLILVVDDEAAVRETAKRALAHWSYEVILAENGQAAAEIFPEIADRLRAAVLDLTMPVMGGEEALARFRKIRPDVPVILTSGYTESDAMRRMRGKGVSAFLQKPFTAHQLGGKLRDILRGKDFPAPAATA